MRATALSRFALGAASQRIWIRPRVNFEGAVICYLEARNRQASCESRSQPHSSPHVFGVRSADSRCLLPHAKSTEDPVQQIIGVNRPNHGAEFLERQAKIERHKFGGLFFDHQMMRLPEMLQARIHVAPAATQTGAECVA